MDEQQSSSAWSGAEERYQSGQEVQGIVTRVAQFGVFVQIEPGLEGIVYTFEFGDGPFALAGIAPGQELKLYVKSVDARRKRLELSLGRATSLPGLLDEHQLPPDARLRRRGSEASWPPPAALPQIQFSAQSPACPVCQRQIQAGWKFCVYCGGSLQRRCPVCGSTLVDLPDARFCHECGKPV
ncbi:MAG TPA: zinc ribbon domain-containing protein [Ktedonobacteraceae bacterium]|nr:zinc ribbon domain-containing protein [Ktedonobacteraceae bacterium]